MYRHSTESSKHAAMSTLPTNDDTEIVPIPLDAETRVRLARLARFVGDHPVKVAASLLHDLLRDDEDAELLCGLDARKLN